MDDYNVFSAKVANGVSTARAAAEALDWNPDCRLDCGERPTELCWADMSCLARNSDRRLVGDDSYSYSYSDGEDTTDASVTVIATMTIDGLDASRLSNEDKVSGAR